MMEKLSQLKNKLFNLMPKQQSMVVSMAFYQNPAMSPRGCKSHKVSIIPKEARKNHRSASFGAHEPTSPKVSCVGQVQSKKKKRKAQKHKRAQQAQAQKGDYDDGGGVLVPYDEKKGKGQRKSEKGFVLEEEEEKWVPPPEPSTQVIAPSLGGMKKFTSGRGSLYDFDVTLER